MDDTDTGGHQPYLETSLLGGRSFQGATIYSEAH